MLTAGGRLLHLPLSVGVAFLNFLPVMGDGCGWRPSECVGRTHNGQLRYKAF